MFLPALKNKSSFGKAQIVSFGGINRAMVWKAGELRESRGLSSSLYPSLSQRESREKLLGYTAPTAIFGGDKLCVVDGTDFKYDGVTKGTVTAGKKLFAAINTKIVIFPDKKYYDISADEFGDLGCKYTSGAGEISFTAGTVATTGTAFSFKAGDGVEISGCTNADNNKSAVIREISGDKKTLTFDDSIFTAGAETATVTIERKIPTLETLCQRDNRIWGTEGATIYGCALGDPTNFFVYDGVSTDSYAVAVGSAGKFTGCAPYGSHICFFKEDKIHKLYGSKPSNYQLDTYDYCGVMEGSAGSLVTINETLYYHGRAGIYAYYGGAPELISVKFGDRRYSEAYAGSEGEKYYVSLKNWNRWELMVFDPQNGIWLKDGDTKATGFCKAGGELYMLGSDGIYLFNSGEEDVDWMAELCPFTENEEGKKTVSRLSLRLKLAGTLEVQISYDGRAFETVYTGHGDERFINIPIPIRRCDTFSIKLQGRGKCVIQSLVRQVSVGSEA